MHSGEFSKIFSCPEAQIKDTRDTLLFFFGVGGGDGRPLIIFGMCSRQDLDHDYVVHEK